MNQPAHIDLIDLFRAAMREYGIDTDDAIVGDGVLHKFRVVGDRSGSKNGWYRLHLDGLSAGAFGCWKRDVSETWCSKSASKMTEAERAQQQARIETSKREQEAERERVRAECKSSSERLWGEARDTVAADHPYLVAKGVRAYGLKQLGEALLVPVRADGGGLVGLQFIQPDASKRFKTGTPKAGCYHRITGDMERVLICEGYATGASLHEATGSAVAIAFDAGNLLAVAQAIRTKLPDTDLVLCADNDRYREDGNIGLDKATAAALAVGGLLAAPAFTEDATGTDFNDLHQLQGAEAVRAAVEAAYTPEALTAGHAADADGPVIKPGVEDAESQEIARHSYGDAEYLVRTNGVFYSDNKDTRWLCSRLIVKAKTRDEKSGEWGRLLEWSDDDGVIHRWAMPMELLQGDGSDVRRELSRQGLSIAPSKTARDYLASYLSVWPVDARARCVDRLGWHGGVYLTPTETIGADAEEVVFQNAHAVEPAFSVAGTLADWQANVARLAVGNSRMVFAISVSLAGPLADIAGEDSGGFHLRGASSSGKSTALKVAASVWGKPEAYRRLWRATANGLEGLAALHNDGVLILDELSQIDPKEAGASAYMLANGQGKARSSRNGMARQAARWRVIFLSAGEVSLSQLITTAGGKSNAGQEIRLADIAADAGAGMGSFEALNSLPTPSGLSDALSVACAQYHGAIGVEWLHKIVGDRPRLADVVANAMTAFVAAAVPAESSGQVMRVARRFALVAVAGELATDYGLTGWSVGEASKSAQKCFDAWLEGFGGAGNREGRNTLAQVRAFFEAHGSSRFEAIDAPENQRVINRVGYYRQQPDGQRQFLVMPESFQREICSGLDHKMAEKELLDRGWIERGGDGRATQKLRGLSRVYVFTQRIWEDE